MASRVYKTLTKGKFEKENEVSGFFHREHRSRKGRRRNERPNFARRRKEEKRAEKEIRRTILRAFST